MAPPGSDKDDGLGFVDDWVIDEVDCVVVDVVVAADDDEDGYWIGTENGQLSLSSQLWRKNKIAKTKWILECIWEKLLCITWMKEFKYCCTIMMHYDGHKHASTVSMFVITWWSSSAPKMRSNERRKKMSMHVNSSWRFHKTPKQVQTTCHWEFDILLEKKPSKIKKSKINLKNQRHNFNV